MESLARALGSSADTWRGSAGFLGDLGYRRVTQKLLGRDGLPR